MKNYWGLFGMILFLSCGEQEKNSQLKIVDIPQSHITAQGIGDCWIHAIGGWLEAVPLTSPLSFSIESLLYFHFERRLMSSLSLSEAGEFFYGVKILKEKGLVTKEQYQKIEKFPLPLSEREKKVKEGLLKISKEELDALAKLPADLRLKEVQKILDTLFDLEPSSLYTLSQPLSAWTLKNGVSLEKYVSSLKETSFPGDYSLLKNLEMKSIGFLHEKETWFQNQVLAQVAENLQKGYPVPLSWVYDSHAMDGRGLFTFDSLKNKGKSGEQAFHLSVVVDYTAVILDDQGAVLHELGEGFVSSPYLLDLPQKIREGKAKVTSFIVRNSWGERKEKSWTYDHKTGFDKLHHSFFASWIYSDLTRSRYLTPIQNFYISSM